MNIEENQLNVLDQIRRAERVIVMLEQERDQWRKDVAQLTGDVSAKELALNNGLAKVEMLQHALREMQQQIDQAKAICVLMSYGTFEDETLFYEAAQRLAGPDADLAKARAVLEKGKQS